MTFEEDKNCASSSTESGSATPASSVEPVYQSVVKDFPSPALYLIEQTPNRFLASCARLDLEMNPFEKSLNHSTSGGELGDIRGDLGDDSLDESTTHSLKQQQQFINQYSRMLLHQQVS